MRTLMNQNGGKHKSEEKFALSHLLPCDLGAGDGAGVGGLQRGGPVRLLGRQQGLVLCRRHRLVVRRRRLLLRLRPACTWIQPLNLCDSSGS